MDWEFDQIGFKGIPIVIKITSPSHKIKDEIDHPKHDMISDGNGVAYFLFE